MQNEEKVSAGVIDVPAGYVSSVCEVKSMRNELLATGYISVINDEYIELTDRSNTLPVVPYETIVKINVFNSRLGFRVLIGKVYISTLKFLRIVEVNNLLDYERRNFFRVDTNLKAFLQAPIAKAGEAGEEEIEDIETLEIDVYNLSLGGVCFATDRVFELGDALVLCLRIERVNHSYNCTVRRKQEMEQRGGYAAQRYLYGCEFYRVPNASSDALCGFIFKQQRLQMQQRKQSSPVAQ